MGFMRQHMVSRRLGLVNQNKDLECRVCNAWSYIESVFFVIVYFYFCNGVESVEGLFNSVLSRAL